MTQRKVNEHLSSLVSPRSHFSILLARLAVLVHCVTFGKSCTFSISESEGVVSRGNGGPLFSFTHSRSWKGWWRLCLWLTVGRCHTHDVESEKKRSHVCGTDELLASKQCVWGTGGRYDFIISACESFRIPGAIWKVFEESPWWDCGGFYFFLGIFSYHLRFLQAYRKHLCKNKQKWI